MTSPAAPAPDAAPRPLPSRIYHIAHACDWDAARAAGLYRGATADIAGSFIHFSTREQVAGTLARHFAGQGDLILLAARTGALGDGLRWEPVPHGGCFPHYYGALPVSRLLSLGRILLDPSGGHVLPPGGRVNGGAR